MRRRLFLCLLCAVTLCFLACTAEDVPPAAESAPVTETITERFPLDSDYALVASPDALDNYTSRGITLMQQAMSKMYSVRPSVSIDTRTEPAAHEILIGSTTRAESAAPAAALAEMDGRGLHIFLAQAVGEKLLLSGSTPEATARGTQWFIDTYLTADGAQIPADLYEIRYVTAADFAVHKMDAPIYDAKALAEIADLHTITLDGVPMEEFRVDQTEYILTLPRGTKIPAAAAEVIAGTTLTAFSPDEGTFLFRVVSASGQTTKEYKLQIEIDAYNYPAVTIEKTPTAADSIVVIVHDDGTQSTASWLAEEFEKYDLRGTIALITNRILAKGVRQEESIAFWQSILDTGRFGITSHTRTHRYWGRTDAGDSGTYVYTDDRVLPYSTEPGHITGETMGSREDLMCIFPGVRALTFAEPGFGRNSADDVRISEEALALIKKYFIAMRTSGGGVDTIPPKDPYAVKSTSVSSGHTAAKMISYTDKAVAQGGMIVYLFHQIEGDLRTETSQFLAHVSNLQKENKLWCTTFEEAALYTEELRTAKASARQDDGGITLTLTDEWDNTVYDHPLTVRVEIVEEWDRVRIRHGDGSEEILPVQKDADGAFVHVKSVPDSGEIRITAH